MSALTKLLDALCAPLPATHVPSSPPPPACKEWKDARVAEFAGLDDLETRFSEFREKHMRFLGSAARRANPADRRGLPGGRPALPSPSGGADEGARRVEAGGAHRTWSLMYALLNVADPSTDLLAAAERDKCTLAFVERATWSISNDLPGVASAYRAAVGPRSAQLSEVLDSLRDLETALSDEGANDAALLHIGGLLGAALVIRRGDGDGCVVLPPGAASNDPAILVAWSAAARGYELRSHGREPLFALRARLCREAGITAPPAGATLEELQRLAERVAAQHLPGGGRATKGRLAGALAEAAAGL
jgi:hypothetical protein